MLFSLSDPIQVPRGATCPSMVTGSLACAYLPALGPCGWLSGTKLRDAATAAGRQDGGLPYVDHRSSERCL